MATLHAPEPYQNIQFGVRVNGERRTYQFADGVLEVDSPEEVKAILKDARVLAPHLGITVEEGPGEGQEPPREPDDSPGNPDPQQDPATGSEVTPEATQEAQDEADTTSDGELATPSNPGGDFPARTEDATGGELPAHDDNRLVEGDVFPPDTVVTEPQSENLAGKPLERMNRDELVEVALTRGVDPVGLTKAQIRERLAPPLDKDL